jgi:hypothetical protein
MNDNGDVVVQLFPLTTVRFKISGWRAEIVLFLSPKAFSKIEITRERNNYGVDLASVD